MTAYPWGETTPGPARRTTCRTPARTSTAALVFREQGTPTVAERDRARLRGRGRPPTAPRRAPSSGPDHRGPQDPAVICPATATDAQHALRRHGVRQGHRRQLHLRRHGARAGGTHRLVRGRRLRPRPSEARARAAHRADATRPRCCARKIAARRRRSTANTRVDLPGDRLLQQQRRVEQAEPRRLRAGGPRPADPGHQRGQGLPGAVGTVAKARWIGAGWPDYPWLFAHRR